jgi:class 3 adenylate cyclase/tetratricopeptide (TPR) repeat protein
VLCAKCKRDNPADAQFCQGCGAQLELICSACTTANGLDANFCKKCGTRLAASTEAPSETAQHAKPLDPSSAGEPAIRLIAPQSDVVDGERKTLTALFADIKGSMELMEDLDPEEARAIVDPALKLMIDAVHRYGGYIVQSTGDGIFALLGAPFAHEDHPQRALYAALRLQEEMRRYSAQLRQAGNLPVEARVGVNTGEVVVRSIATGDDQQEYTPIGHSMSLAARMQALAPTGSIAVTDDTRKLCEGYFTFRTLGPTRVKGVSEPVEVFEVTGLGPLRTRLQVAARRGLTNFIGREGEMAQMRHALELAREGRGQVVGAIGEAGVGKSRLFFEFKAVAESGCLLLEAYSISHGKATAYLPVVELLRDYFRIVGEDDERHRREKIAGKVLILERSLEDTLPYIFSLIGIQENGAELAQTDPQVWRKRTQDAIKRILLRESLNQPLILVFEDLHWIDAETQAFLNEMVGAIGNARILLLVNYRPEYRHEWGNRTCYSQLRLDPLSRQSAEEMLGVLLGVGAGLEELHRLIAERTEGNPFFIEEIVQALFEQDALVRNGQVKLVRPLADIKVPPTVQAVLSSRIDRLPPIEKELLQVLAVIGREFRHSLVRRVAGISDNELDLALSTLRSSEFIYEQPAFLEPEYAFKHALTQEVAYNSVLLERRKQLHERAGAAIEEMNADRLEDSFDELSRHYSHSNNRAKALRYLQLAAEQAIGRSRHNEALAYAVRGLELVEQTGNQECLRAELSLQLVVARVAATTTLSYLPEAEAALSRAYELGHQIGRASETFPVTASLWTRYLLRGDLRKSYELALQLVKIGEQETEERFQVVSHFALGDSLYWQGHFREALDNLNQAIAKYHPALGIINLHGWDSVVFSQLYGALCVWHLGHPDKAMPMLVRASERAASLKHTETTGMVRLLGCILHLLRRDHAAAEREAQLLDWLYKDLNATSYDPLCQRPSTLRVAPAQPNTTRAGRTIGIDRPSTTEWCETAFDTSDGNTRRGVSPDQRQPGHSS